MFSIYMTVFNYDYLSIYKVLAYYVPGTFVAFYKY